MQERTSYPQAESHATKVLRGTGASNPVGCASAKYRYADGPQRHSRFRQAVLRRMPKSQSVNRSPRPSFKKKLRDLRSS